MIDRIATLLMVIVSTTNCAELSQIHLPQSYEQSCESCHGPASKYSGDYLQPQVPYNPIQNPAEAEREVRCADKDRCYCGCPCTAEPNDGQGSHGCSQ